MTILQELSAEERKAANRRCRVLGLSVLLVVLFSFCILTIPLLAQAVRTIVTNFDYSGPHGDPWSEIPSKIVVKVKETNEVLSIAENLGAISYIETGEKVIRFRKTYYADGKPIHQSIVSLTARQFHQIQEETETFRIVYSYRNGYEQATGVASLAEVFEQKTNNLLARYNLDTTFLLWYEMDFYNLEEKHFDKSGKLVFHAKLRITKAGMLADEEIVIGKREATYIYSWPTSGKIR
ncbi:MAG: hypothetical protein AAB347_00315 [Bacteroidota bacterium]